MSDVAQVGNAGAGPVPDREQARLWKATHDLEGVFLSQLFRAMRETVPDDEGLLSSTMGEEIFSAMYDETISALAARQMHRGLGDALYRQLSQRLNTE